MVQILLQQKAAETLRPIRYQLALWVLGRDNARPQHHASGSARL
jgi:hypothetical protein